MTNSKSIQDFIQSYRSGYTLPQAFYCDQDVFLHDQEKVFGGLWHIAGHVSRISSRGDYFLFKIGQEEIIIVHEGEGKVNAHYNVCRHRGSRVCKESEGRKSALVCPYHAWTYNLDGSLRKAPLMSKNFKQDEHHLHTCHVRVLNGIIFVCTSRHPREFEDIRGKCTEYLDYHGIADAKIARRESLPTHSNWKLVVENFIECYHCIPAHPEYCSVHSQLKLLAAGAGLGSGPEEANRQYQLVLDKWIEEVKSLGHPLEQAEWEDGGGILRAPINEGALTESQDGQPVAPLMGKFKQYDGGVTAIAFNYLNYMLASNDHAVLLRFTPRNELFTDVEATWLVDGKAVDGVDYDPKRVSWVWDVTLRQDATITDDNQAGILSSHYQPGPYSEQEKMNLEFTEWYVNKVGEGD